MMPYSAGLVGLAIKRRTGLPTVMNLDDSPTCSDMHPWFATPWHYRRSVAFEDRLARESDAVVYVSQRTMERVRDRQPAEVRGRFHLVRYGADPADFAGEPAAPAVGVFRIVYVGGMTGWFAFPHRRSQSWLARLARRALAAWNDLGRYQLADLDQRGSSPVFVARAAQQVMRDHPAVRIVVEVYGNRYPQAVVDQLLAGEGVADVVRVHGPVPNAEAVRLARGADLLFMTLPDRRDGSPGGRISAKTYEYLMTDRPILAALPPGEGPEFLAPYPGVTVVRPTDVDGMAAAIRSFATDARRFQRPTADLVYDGRAAAFIDLIRRVSAQR
jgi:glycosyltransferase involved in cell wall biosynthesis